MPTKRKWLKLVSLIVLGMGLLLPQATIAADEDTIIPSVKTVYLTDDDFKTDAPGQTVYIWADSTSGHLIASLTSATGTTGRDYVDITQNQADVKTSQRINLASQYATIVIKGHALPNPADPNNPLKPTADIELGKLTLTDPITRNQTQIIIEYTSTPRENPKVLAFNAPVKNDGTTNTLTMIEGDSIFLSVAITPDDTPVDTTLEWSSNKSDIVTTPYGKNIGLLRALKVGDATVTVAAANDANINQTVKITVLPKTPDTFTAEADAIYLDAGQEKNLVTLLHPVANKTDVLVSYDETKITLKQGTTDVSATKKIDYTKGRADLTVSLVAGTATTDYDKPIGQIIIGDNTVDSRIKQAIVNVYLRKPDAADTLEKIILSPAKVKLPVGETTQVIPTLLPADAKDQSVEWFSDQPETVSVDPVTGIITALQPGNATISIKAKKPNAQGEYAMASLMVEVPHNFVYVIESDMTNVRLAADAPQTLHLTIKPAADKTFPVKIEGEYSKYVDVKTLTPGQDGVPMAEFVNGQLTLTVEINQDKLDELKALNIPDDVVLTQITVGDNDCLPAIIHVRYQSKSQPITSIVLDRKTIKLEKGQTYQLTSTIKPANATNLAVDWTSTDDTVATVQDGLITAVKPGEAIIRVQAQESYGTDKDANALFAYAEVTVQVYETLAEDQKIHVITDDNLSIIEQYLSNGEKMTIAGVRTLKVELPGTNIIDNEDWIWSSDKPSTAKIVEEANDPNGQCTVQIVNSGQATIRVKGAVSKQTYSFVLDVLKVPAERIEIHYIDGDVNTDDNYTDKVLPPVAKGRKLQLEAKLFPDNATPISLKWSSSDTKVATITSSSGLLTVKSDSDKTKTTITVMAKNGNPDLKAQTFFEGSKTEPIADITVWECDANGLPKDQPADLIISTQKNGDVTTFINATDAKDVDGKYKYKLETGQTKYFRVSGAATDLTTDSNIKWIAPIANTLTVKATAINDGTGDTLLKVSAVNNAKKAVENPIVRVVASNVGNYQYQGDTSTYENYPEIIFDWTAAPPDAITIIGAPKFMEVNDSKTLKIKTTPSNCDTRVTWESSDKAVIQVADDGTITAVGMGTATITATSESNQNATAEVTITVDYKVSSLKLNATSITLHGDEKFQLEVSVQPYGILLDNSNLRFESRDPYIAEVTPDGIVSLYQPQTAQPKEYTYIDVWANDQKKMSCKVIVGSKPFDKPTADELKDVTVTSKIAADKEGKHVVMLAAGSKAKQLGYTIKGLTTEQKKRVTVDWTVKLPDSAPDTVKAQVTAAENDGKGFTLGKGIIIYIDDIGYVSRVTNPDYVLYNTVEVTGKFYYEGTQIGDPNGITYTVILSAELQVDVGDGQGFTDKPALVELPPDIVTNPYKFKVQTLPPGSGEPIPKNSSTFSKYLTLEKVQEDPANPLPADVYEYQVKINTNALSDKAKTVSLTLQTADKKDNITIKFKIPAKKA